MKQNIRNCVDEYFTLTQIAYKPIFPTSLTNAYILNIIFIVSLLFVNHHLCFKDKLKD